MPTMPRVNKKTARIAFDIIGTPANLQKRRISKKKRDQKDRLINESQLNVTIGR